MIQKPTHLLFTIFFLFALLGCSLIPDVSTQSLSTCNMSSASLSQTPVTSTSEIILPKEMRRANIIFILTDDMDAASLAYMPKAQKLLLNNGANFDNYLINVSLCCPSRATTLLGLYAHNSKILTNNRPNGGFATFQKLGYEKDNVATRMQAAGYKTILLGKYLNGYPYPTWKKYIPPGWTEWYSPVEGDPYKEYNYALNENKQIVRYGDKPENYLTDVLSIHAQDFISRTVKTGQPFFMYLAPYAPHGPATPPARYMNAFSDTSYPQPPSFNELDVSDKPKYIQELKLLSEQDIITVNEFYRNQLQSLAAVDDMIEHLVITLEAVGQLENTYIFFTSDNGLHMGQHRLLVGKMSAYEEDIRVPMVVRGPGVIEGKLIQALSGNIDLAPTFLDIAGIMSSERMDGQSLLPLLAGKSEKLMWRDAYLIEHWEKGVVESESGLVPFDLGTLWDTERNLLEPPNVPSLDEEDAISIPEYAGLRTQEYAYIEYVTGERELYDFADDPYELNNLVSSTNKNFLGQMSEWLACMRICVGGDCSIFSQQPAEMTSP